jgi:Flp pilus assembly protein TadG
MHRHLHHRPSRERGVAAVEFGIVAMLLVTLLLGASEFGRAMYQYNTVVKSTRAAVRHLSQFAPGDAAAIAQAVNLAVYGSAGGQGTPQVPGLTAGMVSVCDAASCPGTHQRQPTGRGVINLVTVTITGLPFQTQAGWLVPTFTFDAISATMAQQL